MKNLIIIILLILLFGSNIYSDYDCDYGVGYVACMVRGIANNLQNLINKNNKDNEEILKKLNRIESKLSKLQTVKMETK